ncbi:hypothetical protein EI94DRAFT_1833402 [Lactarius quietus]|nr:hypothetical protein EI94DRAFT_1833402 [Lactarius quietus]
MSLTQDGAPRLFSQFLPGLLAMRSCKATKRAFFPPHNQLSPRHPCAAPGHQLGTRAGVNAAEAQNPIHQSRKDNEGEGNRKRGRGLKARRADSAVCREPGIVIGCAGAETTTAICVLATASGLGVTMARIAPENVERAIGAAFAIGAAMSSVLGEFFLYSTVSTSSTIAQVEYAKGLTGFDPVRGHPPYAGLDLHLDLDVSMDHVDGSSDAVPDAETRVRRCRTSASASASDPAASAAAHIGYP